MDNYIIGLYDDRHQIYNKELANRYKELSEFFIRHIKVISNTYIIGKSINEVLNKALEKNIDYCIVMSVGHFINDSRFFTYIEKWISKVDFFVTGHIIDHNSNNSRECSNGNYWGLHKQCLLINLKYYEKFGCPEWGDRFINEDKIEVTKAKRSKADIHDDYTPIFLEPTSETQICTPYVDGWNFINISLENNLKVYNFHPKIRATKRYAYPNKSVEELSRQLDWIKNILNSAQDCVFLWNTETYHDIVKYSYNKQFPIEKLYSVAAGFKPNLILEKVGFSEKTEIIYFDYSKQALAFKKYLLENWNGKDYPNFIRKTKKRYKINETFGTLTEGKSYEEIWEQRELYFWQSPEILTEHWQKYKTLKHNFIHCNLLQNPEILINKITQEGNSIIWWSNVFHTVTAHYTRSLSDLTEHYNTFIKSVIDKNSNLTVFGTDILNKKFEGINIKDCIFNQ